jgi:hypothetical protein
VGRVGFGIGEGGGIGGVEAGGEAVDLVAGAGDLREPAMSWTCAQKFRASSIGMRA